MAFRIWKLISILFIVIWLGILGYFALTDYINLGHETKQLRRAKRVLDKSQLVVQKLRSELRSLKERIAFLTKNCKKKCPVIRQSVSNLKDALSTDDVRGKSEEPQIIREKAREGKQKQNGTSYNSKNETQPLVDLKLEIIRRRAMKEHREMWYFLSAEVTKINKLLGSTVKERLTSMLDNFADIHRALGNDMEIINNQDAIVNWRKKEQAHLSKLVENRLRRLQNPKDCKNAKKLICDLSKGCGYGCQVHHLLYCFITAYGTRRTLIINSLNWRYSPGGWERIFLPVSDTCTEVTGPRTMWSAHSEDSKNVHLPIVDGVIPKPKHLPLAVPSDLSKRIQSFHGFPFIWWIGQFARYLFRYQPSVKREIEKKKAELGFKTPIVGIHVRRTDKLNVEAAYHSLEEYMYWVDLYFKKLSSTQTVERRNVFLATDDHTVLPQARKQFPRYNFVSDNDISRSAGLHNRYTQESLHGIIFDVQMLSECDYIVCTLSSQVCRLAYEMMQGRSETDASDSLQSLDDVYYFGGQSVNDVQAIYGYTAKKQDEISIKSGERLKIAGNHWDGYSKATSRSNGRTGLFPSYLVEKYLHVVDFPNYSDFDDEIM